MSNEAKDYQDYKSDRLIKQKKVTLYYQRGEQALYEILDTYSNGFYWKKVYSYKNESDNPFKKSVKTITSFRSRVETETGVSVNFGAEFKGLSFGINGSMKTISENEVTTTREVEETIEVAPHTALFFYQKVYRFKVKVWYLLDARGSNVMVGGYGNTTPAGAEWSLELDAEEYSLLGTDLTGSTDLPRDKVTPVVQDPVPFDYTEAFDRCTEKCRNYLYARGVQPAL